LKTSFPGVLSGSTAKYPRRSNWNLSPTSTGEGSRYQYTRQQRKDHQFIIISSSSIFVLYCSREPGSTNVQNKDQLWIGIAHL
jgi:hypothetical protein